MDTGQSRWQWRPAAAPSGTSAVDPSACWSALRSCRQAACAWALCLVASPDQQQARGQDESKPHACVQAALPHRIVEVNLYRLATNSGAAEHTGFAFPGAQFGTHL